MERSEDWNNIWVRRLDSVAQSVFIADWSLTHGHSEFDVLKYSINTKNISNSERLYHISLSHAPDWSPSGVQFEHPVPF